MRGFLFSWALAVVPGFSAAQTPTLAPEPAVLVGTYQPDSTNPATRSDIQ